MKLRRKPQARKTAKDLYSTHPRAGRPVLGPTVVPVPVCVDAVFGDGIWPSALLSRLVFLQLSASGMSLKARRCPSTFTMGTNHIWSPFTIAS